MTELLVIIFVAFLIVAFLLDAARKKRSREQRRRDSEQHVQEAAGPQPGPAVPLIADEAGPTQTGRFRAQQVIKSSERAQEKLGAPSAEEEKTGEDEEEAPLPDPFNGRDT